MPSDGYTHINNSKTITLTLTENIQNIVLINIIYRTIMFLIYGFDHILEDLFPVQ